MADYKKVSKNIKKFDRARYAGAKVNTVANQSKNRVKKDTAPVQEATPEEYANDRIFEYGVQGAEDTAYYGNRIGKKATENTVDNIKKYKMKKASRELEKKKAREVVNDVKVVDEPIAANGSVKPQGSVKAPKTVNGSKVVKDTKAVEKTTQEASKKAYQATKNAKKAEKAGKAFKEGAKKSAEFIKKAAIAMKNAVKAIIEGGKALVSAIIAGGWVSVIIIIVIVLVAAVGASVYGIFFSGEDSGTGESMQTAVQEINTEYDNKLLEIRNGNTYDVLEISGSRAVWKEVLSVYSVKVNTDPDNPQEVATMDDSKKQLLKDIFWEMNSISSRTESKSETVITETDDGNGNIVQTETTVTRTYLYITVSHKTVDEMAVQYGFNQEQKDYLTELLQDKNNSLWSSVLYGITASDDQIVTVALSQIGNVGGEPYWSWYGFGSRVEWCACFVSWCANECGYIDTGVIPKFAGCVNGVQWFKDRGQWMDGSAEPVPGMIIFFDWDNKGSSGPQDGLSDHVGIVQKVENGIVYTVEGNSGDSVRVNQYSVGHYEVLGYGVPQY